MAARGYGFGLSASGAPGEATDARALLRALDAANPTARAGFSALLGTGAAGGAGMPGEGPETGWAREGGRRGGDGARVRFAPSVEPRAATAVPAALGGRDGAATVTDPAAAAASHAAADDARHGAASGAAGAAARAGEAGSALVEGMGWRQALLWLRDGAIADIVEGLADGGDVQTGATLLLVLADLTPATVSRRRRQQLFMAYIGTACTARTLRRWFMWRCADLLRSMGLWACAAEVIRVCPDAGIREMNQVRPTTCAAASVAAAATAAATVACA